MRYFTVITSIFASAKAVCKNIDFSSIDTGGENCSGSYNEFPDLCGKYDDDDFIAELICCACGGGLECVDTNFGATNSNGNGCEWYYENPQSCTEDLNDDDFLI